MQGTVFEIIPASSGDVFDLVHDYDRRLAWDTLLSAAYLTDGCQRAEQGATTICIGRSSLARIALKTVYVTFQRPRLAAVKMVNRPPFFGTWAASIRHEDLGPNESRISYTWNFTARPAWLAWLLEPIMQRLFRWETRKRLAALKRHFATSRRLTR
jgi:hypothetical protein